MPMGEGLIQGCQGSEEHASVLRLSDLALPVQSDHDIKLGMDDLRTDSRVPLLA